MFDKTKIIVILILVTFLIGCTNTPAGVNINDAGDAIKETKELGKELIDGVKNLGKDIIRNNWVETEIVIEPGSIHVFPTGVSKSYDGQLKRIFCEIKSETPIDVYVVPDNQTETFNPKTSIIYPVCGTKNVKSYECSQDCNVPFDTSVLLMNPSDNKANVKVVLQYLTNKNKPTK